MYLNGKYQNNFSIKDDDDNFELSGEVDFRWKIIFVYILVFAGFCFLFLSAFQLQIIEGSKNFLVATRISTTQTKQLAPRGIIYDQNGVKLAYNVPSYSIYVKPKELNTDNAEIIIKEIASLIGNDSQDTWLSYKSKAYDENNNLKKVDRVTIKSNLDFEQYFSVLSKQSNYPGVYLLVEPIRRYDFATNFSNILGYIGDPNEEDIKNNIYSESQVGKEGIEKIYDSYLRGTEGVSIIQKESVSGKENNTEVYEPKPGDNIILSIDKEWQVKLSEILTSQTETVKAFAGAGVIMNSKTGEIKAMVTTPSYDNNLFAQGISSKDYNALISNPKQPLFNRPLSMQLPPGSIMKIFGAVSGLESGVIDENTEKMSDRCMDLPGNIKFCEADQGYIGSVNVKEAMARSSNIFFCKLMQDIHNKVGYNYYYDIAKNLGIGSRTGIDLYGEASGILPSADYKKTLTKEPWYIGDECNTVIGQGYVTVTPLQMTVAVSAIINGGELLKPQILDKVVDQNGTVVYEKEKEVAKKVNISEKTLNIVKAGLRMGVTEGTAGSLKTLPGNIMGKTGSADASERIMGTVYSGAHSWIMGCFDYDGENYCFTVMQQLGGRGYKTVPVMKKFINCVYNDFKANCEAIK